MSSLPSGTVTFLFTDIEGSTRTWDKHPEAMKAAVAQHDAILRQAIEAHAGHVVKTTGDGVLAAFGDPYQALAGVLAAQRALRAAPWEGTGPLRARMGLHSGPADERDGDYFGPVLNRAARLMGAGHGGQILLSASTLELVRDHLPADVTIRDLGEHHLKDLARPEHIYQVVTPDLPADFPALNTLQSHPNNLLVQPTPLLGRETELQALHTRLLQSDVRLMTLTGPGGVGKTRLALQAAADLLDHFADGAFFVNLALITDPSLVIPAILQALRLPETEGRSSHQVLAEALARKQMLLLLDNFEQVVQAAADIAALLAHAPGLKVLVTSRIPLHVSGEHEFPVPPLAVPDPRHVPPPAALAQYAAVQLFIERATAAKPTFHVTPQNAEAIAEICRRLDGLPLAIELAAPPIIALTPHALLSRLQRRLPLLRDGGPDRPVRHQTLRNTIAWSYDLLDDGLKTLFRRLAVFVGEFSIEAAEVVCQPEADQTAPPLPDSILGGLVSLVDQNLLRQTQEVQDEPRFGFLEIIREYAWERLQESGEAPASQARHCDYYVRLAEQAAPELRGSHQRAWLERLEHEHGNFRAALRWSLQDHPAAALRLAAALWRFWEIHGYLTEGRELLRQALAATDTLPPAPTDAVVRLRAKALNGAGALAWSQGHFSAALQAYDQSLALWERVGDRSEQAALLNNIGLVARAQCDFVTARARLETSLALRQELGDQHGLATCLNNLGLVALDEGQPAAARDYFEKSLTIQQTLHNQRGIATVLANLALALRDQAQPAAAREALEASLSRERTLSDKGGTARVLSSLGLLARDTGDLDLARTHFEESVRLYEDLANERELALAHCNLGLVAYYQRDQEAARRYHLRSLTLFWNLGETKALADPLEGLGRLECASDPARAALLFGAAETLRQGVATPRLAYEQTDYERHVAALRATLGPDFDPAWRAGQTHPLSHLMSLLLSD